MERRKRDEYRWAEINMRLVQPYAKRTVKIKDFLPRWAWSKESLEEKEAKLKKAFMAMANQSKPNG